MPIYEYACDECGCEFETLVMSSTEEVTCSACGSIKLTKKMSGFAARTKGSDGAVASTTSGCASCASKNCSSCG
ncbi:MAG: zinc ribbon domain-containing protein [Deltaproteobacteria bacterium]|nr:zinc ribbon domain-containing protein [Candidatus Zymogenaceae bacterium]